jgi:hypothetical protein
MRSLKKMLATAGLAIGAAGIVFASAVPAGASTRGDSGHGNYEWIDGFLTGPGALANAPIVPLHLYGAVNTRGSINLGGNAAVTGIPTHKGTLALEHGNPPPSTRLNYRTCRESFTVSTWTKVVGSQSTGAFWGARGNGHAVVVFSAIAPRYTSGKHKGHCNFSPNAQPEPYGAWVSFHEQGTLYLRHHHS